MSDDASKKAWKARFALLASIITTIFIYYIPGGQLLALPLRMLSTLIHELGHGIAGVLVGGSFESFVMFWDGSGQAITLVPVNRFARAAVPMGGLIGPAVFGGFLMGIGRKEKLNKLMLVFIGLFFVATEMFIWKNLLYPPVPSGIAWGFSGFFGVLCLAIGVKASATFCQWFTYFIGVQLALSVFSRADYLFTNVARTAIGNSPSDVQLMSDALFLPYWVWGFVCGGISISCLGFGLFMAFRK